jgi:hypothetical protein
MLKFLNGNFNSIKVDFSWWFLSAPVYNNNKKNNKQGQHNHVQSHETEEEGYINWKM